MTYEEAVEKLKGIAKGEYCSLGVTFFGSSLPDRYMIYVHPRSAGYGETWGEAFANFANREMTIIQQNIEAVKVVQDAMGLLP